jgi:hypothetical protein
MIADHWSAETRTRVTAAGQTRDQWRIKPNSDNHLLDTVVLAAVAASIRGLSSDTTTPGASPKAGASSAATAAKLNRPPPAPSPGGGWIAGFGGGRF